MQVLEQIFAIITAFTQLMASQKYFCGNNPINLQHYSKKIECCHTMCKGSSVAFNNLACFSHFIAFFVCRYLPHLNWAIKQAFESQLNIWHEYAHNWIFDKKTTIKALPSWGSFWKDMAPLCSYTSCGVSISSFKWF